LIRLSNSPRLGSLGFGQLLVSSGAVKRDVWERQYGDLVRELRLGDHVPARLVVVRAASSSPIQPIASGRSAAQPLGRVSLPNAGPTNSLRSARTIFIMSRSGYFNPDELAEKFLKKPEFNDMGLIVTKDRNAADLVIEVDRLAFTTEFPFVVVDAKNKTVVASGQVNSLFGTIPAKIAVAFLKQIREARASLSSK